MLANGKGTDGLHSIIVQIPVAIATVIAKTCEFLTHCLQIFLILKAKSRCTVKHLRFNESFCKFDLTKMLKNVPVTMTGDAVLGTAVAGVTAPGAGTWIGCQRTVQGPVTPAHKCGNHNFHAHAISKYILII